MMCECFFQNAKKEKTKRKQLNENEKNQKRNLKWKKEKEEIEDHYKIKALASPKKRKKIAKKKNYKNACGSSFGPNLGLHYEPWPMDFLLVSSKKWGTNRFFGPFTRDL
jgi:hypothetical protein